MSRFNLIFIFALLLGTSVWAQEDEPVQSRMSASGFNTLAVSYLSWTEFVELDNGAVQDKAYANFYGMAVTYENEKYNRRWGSASEASLLFGQANAGGSQTVITPYQSNYKSWFGVEASYRLAYRVSSQITFSIGPFGLFRQISWPSENNIEAKSGSPFNGGVLGDLRYRLTPRFEVRQTIGTMAFKASTLWSLGVGYKF